MSPSKEQIYGFLNGTVTEDQLRSTLNGPQPAGSTNKNGAAITKMALLSLTTPLIRRSQC